ncbi:MAG: MFS transporter [Paracoccaceae bacterium]
MLIILKNSWALLLGMLLLMLGNGLQGTLLGVRGAHEKFDPQIMAFIMSGYFLGFLLGSRLAPHMIRRVGHVRVFAALASIISAAFILYAAWPNPYAWMVMRVLVGFAFSGVYVVAESWLNDAATNETRGQALSAYLIVQMMGIISAQVVLNFADPNGYILFVVMSVLVSMSFLPILLSVSPAPVFRATKPMTLRQLFITSPLGCVGTMLLGAVFSIQFGMAAVFGTQINLSVREISIFVAVIYIGGMVAQYPIGYLSDRMDRRKLIIGLTILAACAMTVGIFVYENFAVLLVLAAIMGGVANPLYSLLIAYTNDHLQQEDMASASGGLIFLNGIGAIGAPILIGWMMSNWGAGAFFGGMATFFGGIGAYGLYRMTRRASISIGLQTGYTTVMPQSTVVVAEAAQEFAIDKAQADEEQRS